MYLSDGLFCSLKNTSAGGSVFRCQGRNKKAVLRDPAGRLFNFTKRLIQLLMLARAARTKVLAQ